MNEMKRFSGHRIGHVTYLVRVCHAVQPSSKPFVHDEPSSEPPTAWCRPRRNKWAPRRQWIWWSFLEYKYSLMRLTSVPSPLSSFAFPNSPWYWRKSNKSSQAPMSKCGCCGVTIICVILFLFKVAKRKLHAIPGGKRIDERENFIAPLKFDAITMVSSVEFSFPKKCFVRMLSAVEFSEFVEGAVPASNTLHFYSVSGWFVYMHFMVGRMT